MNDNEQKIIINVDTAELNNATDKVKELYKKIIEVKTLANEVTSIISDLNLEIKL